MPKQELPALSSAATRRWTGDTQYTTVPLLKPDGTQTFILEPGAAYQTASIPADLLERTEFKGGE